MTTTWDSGNKSGNITLGRQNCAARTNAVGSTWKGVRGTTSQSSGKLYLEYISGYTQGGTGGWIGGFGNASFNTGAYLGADGNSFGVQSIGNIYGLSGASSGVSISVLGTVMQVAIDLGAKKLWTRTDRTTNWNGSGTADPATGVGGMSYTTTGALFPAWSGFGDGTFQDTCIINAGGFAFTGTIPSGFSAWDTGVPSTGTGATSGNPSHWDSGNKNSNIVLSGSDLIATQNSASNTWAGVRSLVVLNSGQWYFEITVTAYDGASGFVVGLYDSATAVGTNGQFVGVNKNCTGAGAAGWYWDGVTNSGQPSSNNYVVNHVFGFAVDMNRSLIWVKDITAGGNWNNDAAADPVLGKRGAWIPGTSDMYLGFSGFRNGGSSDAATLNAGRSALAAAPPSGYLPLDDARTLGAIAGTSDLVAVGVQGAVSTGTITGTGTLAGVGKSNVQSVGSIAGTGSLVGAGRSAAGSTGAIAGTSSLSAVGSPRSPAAGTITGTSSLVGVSNIATSRKFNRAVTVIT